MSDLPRGWARATLGQLGDYINGRAFKRTEWSAKGRPIIRIQNLTGSSSGVNRYDGPIEEKYIVKPDDLLVSWSATLGAFFWRGEEAVLNQHIFKVHSRINKRFHKYLVDHTLTRLQQQTHGSGMVHITRKPFSDTSVALPPINEQERIVAAVEEEFSRIDAGVAAIARAQRRLNALVGAAMDSIVTDAVSNPTWRLLSPAQIAADIPNALAIGPFGSDLKVIDYRSNGVPLIFVRNIREMTFSGPTLKFIAREKAEELRSHVVRSGDVLITKMGDPPGDTAVYPADLPNAILTADCIKLTPAAGFDPNYLALVMRTRGVRRQFLRATRGVAQQKMSLDRFRKQIYLPVPLLDEQVRIVQRMDLLASRTRKSVREMDEASRLARALRSAVLVAAFSGRIVRQYPNDEPAAILLERFVPKSTPTGENRTTPSRRPRKVVAR